MSGTGLVAAGVAWLDKHDPGWWRPDVDRAIDLDVLDMANSGNCILGQACPIEVLARFSGFDPADEDEVSHHAFQGYYAYVANLVPVASGERDRWAVEHGFQAFDIPYSALTAEWSRVICERRAQAVTP